MSSNQLSSTSVLGVISTCSTSSSWFGGFTRTDLSISRIVIIIVRYLRSSYIHHDHLKKTWFSSDIYFIVRKSCNSSSERMNSDGAKSNTGTLLFLTACLWAVSLAGVRDEKVCGNFHQIPILLDFHFSIHHPNPTKALAAGERLETPTISWSESERDAAAREARAPLCKSQRSELVGSDSHGVTEAHIPERKRGNRHIQKLYIF